MFTLLIQLAKGMEAQSIVGVCSGKNEAIVLEHGATEVIDYTKVKPRKVLCHVIALVTKNVAVLHEV